jgi:hypothetical protein
MVVGILVALGTIGSAIAWLVRLEMKVRKVEEDQAELKSAQLVCIAKREAHESKTQKELSELQVLLGEVKVDVSWIRSRQENGGKHE